MCKFCGSVTARGTCPWSITCPDCGAKPGQRCQRPSHHGCNMHTARYRKAEQDDALACSGFEPHQGPNGLGCKHCSGLPEDHAGYKPIPTAPTQTKLFA